MTYSTPPSLPSSGVPSYTIHYTCIREDCTFVRASKKLLANVHLQNIYWQFFIDKMFISKTFINKYSLANLRCRSRFLYNVLKYYLNNHVLLVSTTILYYILASYVLLPFFLMGEVIFLSLLLYLYILFMLYLILVFHHSSYLILLHLQTSIKTSLSEKF